MCIVPTAPPHGSPAALLSAPARRQLALEALAGHSVSGLAARSGVSRRFIYRQVGLARQALDRAFAPPRRDDPAGPDRVLFHLPVTRAWLRQLVLGLLLINHSSYRGVVELLRDLLDYPLSVGQVHDIVRRAVPEARRHNAPQDLSGIDIGAHDEIFQAGRPVLVGCDVASTYCYLLSLEDRRDADTWAVRLLELHERGLAPAATVADAGPALRAGQAVALPGVPCRGDVFHALYEVLPAARHLEARAYEALGKCDQLERKQALHRRRQGRAERKVSQQLRHARAELARALPLADDVAVLLRWLREDVLAVAGPAYATRQELYDFVLAELRARQPQCPHRLGPVCTLLDNQRQQLLAFALDLDGELARVAARFAVAPARVRELLQVQALPLGSNRRWRRDAALREQLGARYHGLSAAVAGVARRAVRASSVIENVNSRLRNYFFLRRRLGPDYLELLRFFLNHRRFLRSEHKDRVGKSPTELLTGRPHEHWLRLLGHTPFSRD